MSLYPLLEPNHEVRIEDGLQAVYCPFQVRSQGEVILHERPVIRTVSFAASASPREVECPVCQVFQGQLHFAGSPDCEDEDGS